MAAIAGIAPTLSSSPCRPAGPDCRGRLSQHPLTAAVASRNPRAHIRGDSIGPVIADRQRRCVSLTSSFKGHKLVCRRHVSRELGGSSYLALSVERSRRAPSAVRCLAAGDWPWKLCSSSSSSNEEGVWKEFTRNHSSLGCKLAIDPPSKLSSLEQTCAFDAPTSLVRCEITSQFSAARWMISKSK